jgi:ribosome-binding factor A
MDGCAVRVAARESGDERVQFVTVSEVGISRDVSTSLDMTET